jgi:pyruvate carboxylase
MTSQPSLAAIVAATNHGPRETGLSLQALLDTEPYWDAVRTVYAPFESGLRAPSGRVYRHEMPGGQISNLRQQAIALGIGDRFEEVEHAYARANGVLGNIVKVTPTSKVVGDLALFVVSGAIDWDELEAHPERFDLPDSVLGYLRGELGEPIGGLPQPFASRALRTADRTGGHESVMDETLSESLRVAGPTRRSALAKLIFPGPFQDFEEGRERYGDVSVVPTRTLLYGLRPGVEVAIDLDPGVRLLVELEAVGDADERGMRTVLIRLNGQLRTLDVRDESIASGVAPVEHADPSDPSHVAAPLAGIVTVLVAEGDQVAEGDPLAVLEAMKMESTITAPHGGIVARVAAKTGRRLESGDLVLVLADRASAG